MATKKKALVGNIKASKKAQVASKKEIKGTKLASLTGVHQNNLKPPLHGV